MRTKIFPYPGNKMSVSADVWNRLGPVSLYIEPFFGTGAMFFSNPHKQHYSVLNDIDGYVCNFWRAVRLAPDKVIPASKENINHEIDMVAWNTKLIKVRGDLVSKLKQGVEYCDPFIAGIWLWGMLQWFGMGWASTPATKHKLNNNTSMSHKKVNEIQRLSRHLQNSRTKILCGDWLRCFPKDITSCAVNHSSVGVFLDPPYHKDNGRTNKDMYHEDGTDRKEHNRILRFCIQLTSNPKFRIALCGYLGEYDYLFKYGWDYMQWETDGGYARVTATDSKNTKGMENKNRELIYFSPQCNKEDNLSLWT